MNGKSMAEGLAKMAATYGELSKADFTTTKASQVILVPRFTDGPEYLFQRRPHEISTFSAGCGQCLRSREVLYRGTVG